MRNPLNQSPSVSNTLRLATLSHLAALINFFTIILGVVITAVIFLLNRKRSPLVAFHALQSLLMQLVLWVGGGLLTILAFTISRTVQQYFAFGICLMPLAFFLALIPISSGFLCMYAAWKINNGEEFLYPKLGAWALKLLQK